MPVDTSGLRNLIEQAKPQGNPIALQDVIRQIEGGVPQVSARSAADVPDPYGLTTRLKARLSAENAASKAGTPFDAQIEQAKTEMQVLKGLQKLHSLNPPVQQEEQAFEPMPERREVALPERPAPGFDPMAGALGLIGGLAAPEAAGSFAAAPLQAGLQMADREYSDWVNRFRWDIQQADQEYQDAAAARTAKVQQDALNADIRSRNAEAKRQGALAAGGYGVQAEGTDARLAGLERLQGQHREFQGAAASANRLGQQVEDADRLRKAEFDFRDQVLDNRYKLASPYMQLLGNSEDARNAFNRDMLKWTLDAMQAANKQIFDAGQNAQDRSLRVNIANMEEAGRNNRAAVGDTAAMLNAQANLARAGLKIGADGAIRTDPLRASENPEMKRLYAELERNEQLRLQKLFTLMTQYGYDRGTAEQHLAYTQIRDRSSVLMKQISDTMQRLGVLPGAGPKADFTFDASKVLR